MLKLLIYAYVCYVPFGGIAARLASFRIFGRTIGPGDFFIVLIFMLYLANRAIVKERRKLVTIDLWVIALCAWLSVSFIIGYFNSNDKLFSALRSVSPLFFLYFPCTELFQERQEILKFIRFMLPYSAVIAVAGIAERFGVVSSITEPVALWIAEAFEGGFSGFEATYRVGRVLSISYCSAFVVFGLALLALRRQEQRTGTFAHVSVYTSLNLAVLLLGKGRWLILLPLRLAGIFVFLKLFSPQRGHLPVSRILGIGILLIALVVTFAYVLPEDWDFFVERFQKFAAKEDYSTRQKIVSMREDWRNFLASPILGNGLGYRAYMYARFVGKYRPTYGEIGPVYLLASLGVIGTGILYGFHVYFAVSFVKAIWRENSAEFGLICSWISAGAIIGLLSPIGNLLWGMLMTAIFASWLPCLVKEDEFEKTDVSNGTNVNC